MNKQAIRFLITVLCVTFFGCDAMATLFHGEKPEDKPESAPITYTVAFNSNGAGGVSPEVQTVNSGTVINLPGKGGMNKGEGIFAGWYESASGITYSAWASVTVTQNMIFYAQWLDSSTPQFTVTFNANGATSGVPPASQTAYSGVSITVPGQGTLAHNGKIYCGWNTQPNGEGTNYTIGVIFTVTGDVMLYAKWQDAQYTVTYDANGADGAVPPSHTVEPGTVITLPGVGSMTYTEKILRGWNTQADGSGTNYAGGAAYTVNSNVTLYAKWGVLALGDTGPGGGKIFYYTASGFTMTDNGQVCHYLEATLADMSSALAWASSDYTGTDISGTGGDLGTGRKNTTIILATNANAPAAKACKDYSGPNNLNDWFLPSRDELNELYTNRSYVGMGTNMYWSSSQYRSSPVIVLGAYYQNFANGSRTYTTSKGSTYSVRAVRAF